MIKATESWDVPIPDYSEQRPHGMIGPRSVWSLDKGELLWIPADTQWGYMASVPRPPEGLLYEVAWSRPLEGGRTWEVVAFGVDMLRLQGLDAFELVQVLLPHVPAICPTCRDMFNEARLNAGLETEEN